jgi:predicted Zn-dependent peptidase
VSDILGRGKSSRLYTKLVKEKQLFNNISGYVTASLDPGLLVIQGNLNEGISLEEADAAIEEVVADMRKNVLEDGEIQKVKNQAESTMAFAEVELLNRAMNLAFAANAGNPNWCNDDAEKIAKVNPESLQAMAKRILRKENCSTMYYRAEK